MKKLWRVVIILSLVLLSIGLFDNNTALAADPYTAWSDQGIIYTAPTGDAYYPSVIYDNNRFGEGSSGATCKMWYSDGSGAFLVTSSNGTSWSAPTPLSGLGNNTNHVQVLYDVNNFGLGVPGPKYRVWYWHTTSIYDISSIYTAQSNDGINWTGASALSQDPGAKLVTGHWPDWNYGSYGPVYLFYQPGAANTGTAPWNYKYVMYYDGTTGSMEETGLAYSSDGYSWKAYSGNPVLAASTGAWDSNYAVYGTVYHDLQGFHFWYGGGVSHAYEGIGYAFSTDGENWTKNPNHIFHVSDGVSYRNARVYTPSIINDGTGFLKMYYTAQSTATGSPKKIGLAYLTIPGADLSITKTDSPDPVIAGTDLTYTITVSNHGPLDTTGVVVTDTLPSGVTYKSNAPSQGSYTSGTGIWDVGSLSNGASATLALVVTVDSSTTAKLTNKVTVSGNETDPNSDNNTYSEDTETAPAAPAAMVGGIAEYLVGGSDSSSPPYAVIIGGAIAALAAITLGGWFARRRWLRRCS